MSAAHGGHGEALAEALEYVAAGYVVGPVTIRLDERGKKVAEFHTRWQYPAEGRVDVSGDPEQVMAWARQHPGCGFHAPCGPNRIVVVDADLKVGADHRLIADGPSAWRAANGPRSPMIVTTQSGGEHLHFRAPADPIRNSAKAIPGVANVDVRGDGGTVFVSGTRVHGGGHYAATRIVPRDQLPELPERWAKRLRDAGPSGDRNAPRERTERPRSRLVGASKVKERDWVEAKVDDELRELGRRGTGDFRARLFEAAAIAYRAVGVGVLDEEEALERLTAAVVKVWGAAPDLDDRRWIRDGRQTAEADPWRLAAEDPAPGALEAAPDAQEGQDGPDAPLASSWAPTDLGPILDGTHVVPAATFLERADGVALLYPGLVHWVYGESESGKSWVCLIAVARVLAAGGRALFVDYESDAPSVVGRLLALAVDPDAIRERFTYVRPETSCADEPTAFAALLACSFDVAVVDGVTEGLGMEGGASVDNDDVTAWVRRIPRRIAQATGAAVACVDHVTKDAAGRGRFPIGGQAKLAALDGAGYLVEPKSAIRPGAVGEIELRVAKDRPGGVRAHAGEWRASDRTQEAARVTIDATDPAALVVTVAAPSAATQDAPGSKFTPTVYMTKVSRFLSTTEGEVATKAIEANVEGRADMIRRALDELALLGYVTRRTGPRNAILYTYVKRYTDLQREASGEALSDPDD